MPTTPNHSHIELLERWFGQAPGFVVFLRGPAYIVELANDAYYRLVGAADIRGKPVFEALPELMGQGFEQLLCDVYTTAMPYVGREFRLMVGHDPQRPPAEMFVDFVYQPVLDDDGKIYGIFVQGHDVTERHRAIDALRDADRRKDQALAMLVHELKGPLQPIVLALHALEESIPGTELRQRRALQTLERQTDSLSRLVDDLTDAVNVRSGRLSLHRQAVSIQDIVSRAVEVCTPAIEKRQHVLFVDAPPEAITVEADIGRMTQVMINLIGNATKYTPPHGVITVLIESDGTQVQVRVSDNGIGISHDVLWRIFEMFMQPSASGDHTFRGLGIGLMLVHRLVTLHGGTVTAHSHGLGQGSEFIVSLPLVRKAG